MAGVRKKMVRIKKVSAARNSKDPDECYKETQSFMMRALAAGRPLVYVDETHFVAGTYQKTAFSRKRENITIPDSITKAKRQTMFMAVSEDLGVVAYILTQRYVNGINFAQLLSQVKTRAPGAAILMDNASYHGTQVVLR